MGLGKTLSMICLIAGNQLPNSLQSPLASQPAQGVAIKTTLLIVPPARKPAVSNIDIATLANEGLVIQSWQNQLHL